MRPRPRMVRWYDPPRLVAVAIRVAISTVFGEFADRRELLATARPVDPTAIDQAYNYREEAPNEDFWFDFMADTGDGWNSTYAVARLLAEPTLAVEGADEPLLRGRILVMGGDEVYPVASREEYQERIVAPFNDAADAARGKIGPNNPPHLYAVPGNHDWYDGLLAFLGLFCRRRNPDAWIDARPGRGFGGRATQQTRSYFAIELPRGWWPWGADVQLAGYIDQPQIDFFEHVARYWMEPGSRLILCTGQPNWTYVDTNHPDPQFKNFSYLQSSAKHHRLCAVLTGDSHHYSRYIEGECSYITSGGGGAFLHPTHQLEEKQFVWDYPRPGDPTVHGQAKYPRDFRFARDPRTGEPAVFPDQKTSRRLAFRNFAFAALNWQYTVTIGGVCAFFAWLLQAQAAYLGSSLMKILAPQPLPPFLDTVTGYISLVFVSPWPIALVLLAASGYYYLADYPGKWRLIVGGLHAAAQAVVVMLVTCVIARSFPALSSGFLIALVGITGGVLSATMLEVYFLLSLDLFGRHWDEAFSALRIQDFKCFLRLRIQPDGALKIYPIGLKNVPREPRRGPLRNPPLHPHLIEDPIEVH